MQNDKPFFSLIVPCCDVADYVRDSFASVAEQGFRDWEFIAVVEDSKDGTLEIVKELASRDSRIRIFTGPRTGSCSASRNIGTREARGEYVIFLDGDDTIEPCSLERIHAAISKRPGADLYPAAMQVHNEMTGKNEELRDNYPPSFESELTGPEATVFLEHRTLNPCPMLQLTVFRREFLVENSLECIVGLRNQDSEFSPRALYLAKRVVPIHEPFYIYRIRQGSVQTKAKGKGYFYKDWTIIMRSLFAFHAKVSKEPGFDVRISECWAQAWISILQIKWFSRDFVKTVPREERLKSLEKMFEGGFGDLNALLRHASRIRRIAGWWIRAFVRHPILRPAAEMFFTGIYFPLADRRGKK